MKKTLAPVLAAMMALSTSAVALAKDTDVEGDAITDSSIAAIGSSTTRYELVYGGAKEYILSVDDNTENDPYIKELGVALEKGLIKIDVTVTEGRSLLKKAPVVSVKKTDNVARVATIKLELKHTYGVNFKDTDDNVDTRSNIDTRVRVTALESFTEGALSMTKGDTLSVDELLFRASYDEILNYGKDMTITEAEVSTNNVIVDASKMLSALDKKGTETATFYFDDTAAFTAKISEAQKNLNVYYSTAVADEYYEEYPEVAFEAIEFKGAPKFLRKGTLTFNAIGDEDTVVYEVTADGLVELEIDEYDATYETITVDGINKLTSYLVASEALEVEAEVEVEEPAVEEENPNTGAC